MKKTKDQSMIKWNEYHNSEKPALDLLQQLGYTYLYGKELSPDGLDQERQSLREVILKDRVIRKIKDFNPWINDINIKQVIRRLTIPDSPDHFQTNKHIWEYLTKPNALAVEQDFQDGMGRRNRSVKLIDWINFENNEFLCSNQFKVNAPKGNRIPDIVIFINGLPLVIIECKSPVIKEKALTQGIWQVMQYQEIIPKLFHFNQFIIITAGQSARFGVVKNSFEHYLEWKEPIPLNLAQLEEIIAKTGRKTSTPTPQDILIYGLLEPHNLLDIIQNYIIYQHDRGNLVKKIARYQQFRAVNKTLERIITTKDRGGTIWHTQGSGKSLTMLFTAIKLRREKTLENPLLVFVSDRIDLINQLKTTFKTCGFSNPLVPKNADKLQNLIQTGQGVTIFTTSQKFREDRKNHDDEKKSDKELEKYISNYPVLNTDQNIFVLVDEAHRSQYKLSAMRMRKSMPNAFYIAYTGTPLARTEKNEKIAVGKGKTVNKFGSLIDVYDIRQSVEDGATVPIYYENRLPELQIEGDTTMDELFDLIFDDKTEEEKEEIKKKYGNKANLLQAKERIKKIVIDIIKHHKTHTQPNNFKAQIVTSTRELAVKYKMYLDKYNAPESCVIISENVKYDTDLKKLNVDYITKKDKQQEMVDRFTDPDDPLTFLIVCDMLITGFDAPIEQVMYLDKSLREHNLLQAIARVNRTYEGKTHGLIVDYFGVSLKLQDALEIFDSNDVEGALKPIDKELPHLEQYHRQVMGYLEDLDISDLEGIVNELEPEETRASFYADFKKFAQCMDMILPDPRAEPYVNDLKFLERIISALRVRTRDEHLNIAGCGGKVKQLIDDHIRSLKITQLVAPVPILSDKFQEIIDGYKTDKARASEIEHAVKHEISVHIEEDPTFYTSLKDRLEEIIEMYRQERIDLAEKINRLKLLVTEIKEKPNVAKLLGLNSSEMAFYNLFKKDLNDVNITDEREIMKFTYEVLEVIEPYYTLVDWERKQDILREIRKACKNTVFPNYPIDKKRYQPLSQEVVTLAKTHYSY